MKTPTPKQLETLRYIADYQREHGFPPSIRDLVHHDNICIKWAWDKFVTLERLGLITRPPKTSRNIRLTDRGRELLMADQATDTAGNVYEKILLGGANG